MKTLRKTVIMLCIITIASLAKTQNTQTTINFGGENIVIDYKFYTSGGEDSTRVIRWDEIGSSQLKLSGTVMTISPRGNLHFYAESINTVTAVAGTINILFYDQNKTLIFQIIEKMDLKPGLNIINSNNQYVEISKNYLSISGSKIIINMPKAKTENQSPATTKQKK